MSTGLLHLHSTLPFLLLALMAITIVMGMINMAQKKPLTGLTFTLAKVAFILSHIQLLVGIVLFFMSDLVKAALESGDIMGNSFNRKLVVEHPVMMILGIVLVSIGYIKTKKNTDLVARNKTIVIFYAIAMLFFLAMIPWERWLS